MAPSDAPFSARTPIAVRRTRAQMSEARFAASTKPSSTAGADDGPLRIFSLDGPHLERFLQRQKAGTALPEIDLSLQLRQILERACQLVPSEAGSIFLDDPLRKTERRRSNQLYFVAAFGSAAEELPGRSISASEGIVGRVYRTGQPRLSADVLSDPDFADLVDEETGHTTRCVLAVPITIGSTVCGVMELVNRQNGGTFAERDLALLEIFASYTSSTLQNALDAKRANELAKRDDLSGLYNDRWLHVKVMEMIEEADETQKECSLVFFDLDRLKAVNDTHGHLAGSRVLREVGYLLRRVVHEEGALLCRYGGDEFVVGLPDTHLPEAVVVAERIREAIEATTFIDREYEAGLPALRLQGIISASLGVANYIPGVVRGTIHEKEAYLLRRADQALYIAKAQGKNQVVVTES
jgi:diguanylate cyclase (GGDEF)-like protein